MFLNKSVVSSLSMALLLSACSGSDGFGVGNGSQDETGDGTGTGTNTGVEVAEALGVGSGESFQVGEMTTSLDEGALLPYGGAATVSVSLVDTNDASNPILTPTTVSFSSTCAEQSLSEIGATATTSNGIAVVEYTAIECAGADTVTASTSSGATATVTIQIEPSPEVIESLGTGAGEEFDAGSVATGLSDGEVLSYGASTTISVNVVDASQDNNGLIQTPTTVTFSSACATQGLATIGESALSSLGTATVNYTATSCTGSDRITATTTDEDGHVSSASVTINISSLGLGTGSGDSFVSGAMSTLTDGVDLTYGGDTIVSVNIVDTNGNSLFTSSSVTASFTSNCVQQGKSEITSSVNTTTGTAVATYTANTCEGPDVITATLSDGTTATASINVAEQILGELAFVSAEPTTIALKGSGSSAHPEVTTVTFSLKDATGEPMAGEEIFYSLSTEAGGLSLANTSSVTDEEGNTSVQLTAGGVNISVAVVASVTVEYADGSEATTSTTSDSIAVLGGLPDQDSFSLSVERFNPRGWNIDGTLSAMTIRASDRYNNEAREGTQISFVTTGGQIVGSCELAAGSCSVNWTSSNPRPDNGLVHIMARTTGEESFIDTNGNGLYDVGETIDNLSSEAYIDVNYNDVRDDDEVYSDFDVTPVNGDDKFAGEDGGLTTDIYGNQHDENGFTAYVEGSGSVEEGDGGAFFQGAGCSEAALALGHCSSLVEVREHATICMSTDDVIISDNLNGAPLDASSGAAAVNVTITDAKGLIPANGTTVSVSVEDGEIVSGQTIVIPNACWVDGGGNPIPFTNTIVVAPDEEVDTTFGILKIKVTRADGVVEEYSISFLH